MSKSIIPGDIKGRCYICGHGGITQVHHMIPGVYRDKSEKYGLKVNLCPPCHRALHDRGYNYREMKQYAQIIFLMNYSMELWSAEFCKNYLHGRIGPFNYAGTE